MKVGIIGVGGISSAHIEAYRKNPRVELYAFCDKREDRLTLMADKYGIEKRFTDASQMLKMPELDAVSVCTWNSEHMPCTILALNAGKHVLCEKPMAMNALEARAMKEAAEKNGKVLMIGFVRRFGVDCQALQDMIADGHMGELYLAKASYLRRKGSPGGWFGEKARSGGGPLIDLGVHVIDLARYLLGKPRPVSVYGVTYQKLGPRENIKAYEHYVSSSKTDHDVFDVEDYASAMVRFDNGATLFVETSYSLNLKQDEGKLQLFGTKAGATLDPELTLYSEMSNYLTDIKVAGQTAFHSSSFSNEIDHFVSCVLDGTTCKAPPEDGIELMRILDAIYKSAETGHEVIL